MERTITKQSPGRSFLIAFKFLIWKERLPSKTPVAASSELSSSQHGKNDYQADPQSQLPWAIAPSPVPRLTPPLPQTHHPPTQHPA
ncbi:hypothetical protein V502_10804 [Pseudogymnoascus sp. VKM F-4520 (FW-2644)]|nr:hypothetical protein V502_10804 [Pseudogymnoascus sp. VKM F-4520 (FW-2644)]